MTRKSISAAVAMGAAFSFGLLSTPAQASTPGAASCINFDTGKRTEGYGNGRVCDGNITGTVHDTKADGRCPYVRIFFYDGGRWDSPWAGGKGTSVNFSGYHPSDYIGVELNYISC